MSSLASTLQFAATLTGGLFAGAALYINAAEHPARMSLVTRETARQWAPSYQRATWLQAPLALLSLTCGASAWFLGAGLAWLVGALFVGAVVPFTFLVIMPTNNDLLAPGRDLDSQETRALLVRWGRLHAVRTALSVVGFAVYLFALTFASVSPTAAAPAVALADQAPWLTYDAGRLRILESSASTGGRYSVLELHESPEYKTPPHIHPDMDEMFYVLEGTLELRLPGKTQLLTAGSYAHIPRNTPHAQGSADDKPVRLLVTVSPGEFEGFFTDRVELMTKASREDADFRQRYLQIVRKHSRWLQPASLESSPAEPRQDR